MNIINSLLGRRQFLIAFMSSAIALVFSRIAKAFNLIFKTGAAKASEKPATSERRSLKGIVIYHSNTGNTGKIAGAIYRGMKAVMNCDIAPVNKLDPKEMGKYDFIAFGGPIWYFREPANLRFFIYYMPHSAGKLCILFATHGAQPFVFFYSIAQVLLKKAFTIIGWNHWYGGCVTTTYPKPYFTDGHPDEIDLKEAEAFGREMAERAIRIYAGEKDLIPEIPRGIDEDVDGMWKPHEIDRTMGGRRTSIYGSTSGGEGEGMPGAAGAGGAPGSLFSSSIGGPQATMSGGDAGSEGQESPDLIAPNGTAISEEELEEWRESEREEGKGPFEIVTEFPEIDFAKCIYPRCTACIDMCIQNAIDFSLMTVPASSISGSQLIIKEACIHCNFALCKRSCYYEAIIYKGHDSARSIDMTKCTYPKCTLCADRCTMQCIDLTQNPPVIHNYCEHCGICGLICPEDAIVTDRDETHGTAPEFSPGNLDHFFIRHLAEAEAAGKFRRLVPMEEIGWDNYLRDHPAPRFVINEEDYPFDVKES
jgi:flavodoxin/formate hydrogenlyase subunit 6/NADH:ubiquinone oxidoreductase subunit I